MASDLQCEELTSLTALSLSLAQLQGNMNWGIDNLPAPRMGLRKRSIGEKNRLQQTARHMASMDLGAGPCGECLHWLDPILDMEFQQAKSQAEPHISFDLSSPFLCLGKEYLLQYLKRKVQYSTSVTWDSIWSPSGTEKC